MKWTWLAAAVALAGWLIARRHKQQRWFQIAELVAIAAARADRLRRHPAAELREAARGRRPGARARGPTSSSALLAFLETGAFLGFIAPGRDRGDRRRPRRRPGPDLAARADRDRLGVLPSPATSPPTSSAAGSGRGWLLKHGERLKITEDRLDQVEGFFDSHGAVMIIVGRFLGFVRPLMPVHRRRVADAAAALPALRRARRRRVVDHVLHARLRLLALDRPAHDLRLARAVRVRHARRGDRRDRRADPPAPQPRGAREGARLASTSATTGRGWKQRREARAPGLAHGAQARPPRSPTSPPASPQARVTPGNLGLELTTLLALRGRRHASRSCCSATSCSTARRAADRPLGVRPRRPPAAWTSSSSIAKVVTDLGSSPVTAALALGHGDLRRRPAAPDRGRRARRRLAAGLRRRAHHARPPTTAPRPPDALVDTFNAAYPVRPRRLRRRAVAVRDRAGARGRRLGDPRSPPSRVAVVLVAVVGVDPRLPARALPHRRARRGRAGGRDLVARRRRSPCSPGAFATMCARPS